MTKPTQYLEWHGQQWRVRIKVPEKLRSIIDKSKLVHPLHTSDLQEANSKKWAVVAHFKTTLEQARKALETDDPIKAEALRVRLLIKPSSLESASHSQNSTDAIPAHGSDRSQAEYDDNYDGMIDRAYEIEKTHGLVRAKEYVALASGAVTPLMNHFSEFVDFKAYKIKTAGDAKRVLKELEAWLLETRRPPYIETLNRKLAGDFIAQSLAVKRGTKKATAYKGFLSQYWKWLSSRGYAELGNP